MQFAVRIRVILIEPGSRKIFTRVSLCRMIKIMFSYVIDLWSYISFVIGNPFYTIWLVAMKSRESFSVVWYRQNIKITLVLFDKDTKAKERRREE